MNIINDFFEINKHNIKSQFFSMLNLYLINGVQLPPRKAIMLLTILDDEWNNLELNTMSVECAFKAVEDIVCDNIDDILYMKFEFFYVFKDLYTALIRIEDISDIMQDICNMNIDLYNYYSIFNIDLVKFMSENNCKLVRLYIFKYAGSWVDWFTLNEVNAIVCQNNMDMSGLCDNFHRRCIRPYVVSNVRYDNNYYVNILFYQWGNDLNNTSIYKKIILDRCMDFKDKYNSVIDYIDNNMDKIKNKYQKNSIYYMFCDLFLNSYLRRIKTCKINDIIDEIKNQIAK